MNSASRHALRPAIIGRYPFRGAYQFLPLTHEELLRAEAAAACILDSYGFGRGQHVLVTSMFCDAAQVLPLQLAMARRNLIVCSADASRHESGRIKSFLLRYDCAGAFGVSGAVLDGLECAGLSLHELFGGKVVWARPDAHQRLQGVPQIELRRWVEIGPALALECRYGDGAHLDSVEWRVETDEHGQFLISSRLERAMAFDRLETGLRGTITGAPCACGHGGARVYLRT